MRDGLNKKIALLRGEGGYATYPPVGKLLTYPAYDSDLAWAGILLDEMAQAGTVEIMRSIRGGSRRSIRFYCDGATGYQYSTGVSLASVIAKAWYIWRRNSVVNEEVEAMG